MYELSTIRLQNEEYINYSYLGIDNNTKNAFVIDPAWSIHSILEILKDRQSKLKGIFLTHSHMDHMNKAEELAEISGSKIYISKEEYTYYELELLNCNVLNHMERIAIGNTVIQAYLTPGHTKGSMCYMAGNNFFTGDTLFIEGCGVCTLKGGNAQEMFQSLQSIKRILKEETVIYPGHAFLAPVGQSAKCLHDNLYMCIPEETSFINIRMRKNQPKEYKYV